MVAAAAVVVVNPVADQMVDPAGGSAGGSGWWIGGRVGWRIGWRIGWRFRRRLRWWRDIRLVNVSVGRPVVPSFVVVHVRTPLEVNAGLRVVHHRFSRISAFAVVMVVAARCRVPTVAVANLSPGRERR